VISDDLIAGSLIDEREEAWTEAAASIAAPAAACDDGLVPRAPMLPARIPA